jgi:hypothetical protein
LWRNNHTRGRRHNGGRGFAVLRTLDDVFAYAAAEGVKLRIDGTEVQVRRPKAGRAGRRAFVSGKKRQNTIKATAVSDGNGRLLWLGEFRPGRMQPRHRGAHRRHRKPAPAAS